MNFLLFKLSKIKLLLLVVILFVFEYAFLSVLSLPYEQLEANSDKYHPLVAYLVLGPLCVLCSLLLVIFLLFFFRRSKGLMLTTNGFNDRSSPFSIGEIPFDKISSISCIANRVTRYRFIKSKTNEICVNLRKRKSDNDWWSSKGLLGKAVKKLHTYTINTKGFRQNHSEIVDAIKTHVAGHNIKVNVIDYETISANSANSANKP